MEKMNERALVSVSKELRVLATRVRLAMDKEGLEWAAREIESVVAREVAAPLEAKPAQVDDGDFYYGLHRHYSPGSF